MKLINGILLNAMGINNEWAMWVQYQVCITDIKCIVFLRSGIPYYRFAYNIKHSCHEQYNFYFKCFLMVYKFSIWQKKMMSLCNFIPVVLISLATIGFYLQKVNMKLCKITRNGHFYWLKILLYHSLQRLTAFTKTFFLILQVVSLFIIMWCFYIIIISTRKLKNDGQYLPKMFLAFYKDRVIVCR